MTFVKPHISLLAAFFIIAAGDVFAQSGAKNAAPIEMSAEAKAALVKRAFQNNLQGTLDKFLKPHQYNLDVQFEVGKELNATDDVPYAPDNIVADTFQGLPTGKQLDAIKNLRIKIQVPKWVDEGTKRTLQALAEKELSERTGRPIKVGMESVALDVEEPKKAQPQAPLAEARPAAPAPSLPVAAADPMKSPELQKALEDLRDLKKQVEDNQSAQAAREPVRGGTWISDLVEVGKTYPIPTIGALILLYLAFMALVFIPSRSLVSGFGQIRSALEALSRSLKSIGDALGQSRVSEDKGDKGGDDKGESQPSSASASDIPLASTKVTAELSLEEIQARVQSIRDNHKPEYDRIVVELVLNYLHEPEKSYWAVFLLDIVGREHARRAFEGLEAADQEELMRLVKHEAPEDKIEATVELIEAYQMRLLTFGWKGGGKSRSLDADIQRTISQLAFEDIPPILNRLGETGIRRFMLYLDSKTMSHLLRSVKRNPQSQRFLISLLAKMPEAIHESQVDADISLQIKAHFQKKQDDLYLPYLTQYEEIVHQVGDDMEDELIEQLSAANGEIGEYLRRRLITMGTFFTLSAEDQKSLLGSFTNNDYAALLSSLSEGAQKESVLKLLDETRKELIVEQLSVLAETNKITLAEKHKDIRRKVRHLIKQLKAAQSGGEFGESEDTNIQPRAVS